MNASTENSLTQRALPLVDARVLKDLDFGRIQSAVADRAQTEEGRARCAALPLLPDSGEVAKRLAAVDELMRVAIEDMSWPGLAGVANVAAAVDMASRGSTLEPKELMQVATTLATGERAANWCAARRARAPLVAEYLDAFGDYAALVKDLDRSFEASGRLADHASPQLGELRRRQAGLRETLSVRMEQLVREFDADGLLQDTFHTLREDRYVLPVKAGERWRVQGIVHDTSQTHQTFFIEPQEVVDLGNRLKAAHADVEEEEQRILKMLSQSVGTRAREITEDLESLHRLDVLCATGRFGVDLHCNVPQLSTPDGKGPREMSLRAFRHPVLTLDEMARKQTPRVISNDLHMGKPRVLVITGPNTGGKTVALKGVGLCALMVRAGLPLPVAPDSVIPLYDRIHSVVGDGQSLAENLSSFGAHLWALKEMLLGVHKAQELGQSCLCVLDEIMSGTDPDQGAALAQATLEHIAEAGAHVVATTHFEKLKALALDVEGQRVFRNASVGLQVNTLAPTYKLAYDAPGSSSALDMAAQLGLPSLVVERARGLSSEQGRKLDGLLKGLALKQAALDEERAAVAKEFDEAATAKAAAEAQVASLQEEERSLKRKAREGMLAETQRVKAQLREAVEQTRAALKEAESHKDVRGSMEKALGHLAKVTELSDALTQQDEEERRAEARGRSFDSPLKVGSRVHVVTLNVPAEVLELTGKDALVAAGALRVRVQLKDLAPPLKKKGPPAPPAVKPVLAGAVDESVPRTLDLRGERVEDAMERLNVFLDRAYGQPTGLLTVIHGHGTGAMRAAVKELLRGHPLVQNSRSGGEREGGTGATVVTLKES